MSVLALTWAAISYGAVLSGIVAAAAVFLAFRRVQLAVAGGASALLGPLAWNAVLHDAGGSGFFHDAPLVVFPVSWQDTGSGVFTLAAACLLLGAGPLSRGHGRRLAAAALVCAVSALLVDVYLY